MKATTVLTIIATICLFVLTIEAQESGEENLDPNEIFNSIMQTMPGDMKMRIDSAAVTMEKEQNAHTTRSPSLNTTDNSSAASDAKQSSINRLPESVREQVRKTMQEIEMGNVERMLQFKEAQKRKRK